MMPLLSFCKVGLSGPMSGRLSGSKDESDQTSSLACADSISLVSESKSNSLSIGIQGVTLSDPDPPLHTQKTHLPLIFL